MPKLKTNRSAAKRFSATKRGGFKVKRSHLRHILTSKNKKRKRHLRKALMIDQTNLKQVRRLLPYS